MTGERRSRQGSRRRQVEHQLVKVCNSLSCKCWEQTGSCRTTCCTAAPLYAGLAGAHGKCVPLFDWLHVNTALYDGVKPQSLAHLAARPRPPASILTAAIPIRSSESLTLLLRLLAWCLQEWPSSTAPPRHATAAEHRCCHACAAPQSL